MKTQTLIPGQMAPALQVPTLDKNTWTLAEQQPSNLTMIVFYRGRHCPVCANYLSELDPLIPNFIEAGVSVVAVSCDGDEQALAAQRDWKLKNLTIGYNLSIEVARSWGLFVTQSRRKTMRGELEDFLHSEPALYFIRPNGTLFLSSVQSSVFGRAPLEEMLKATHFLRGKAVSPPGSVAAS